MKISCAKQSDTPKYVAHLLGVTVSKKYRHHKLQHGQVRCTRIKRSRVKDMNMSSREQTSPTPYNNIIAGSSCHRGDSLKFLFRGSITVRRQQ